MKAAVLAVQGDFIEHENMLRRLGIETMEIRQSADLSEPFDALVLPGGESTVQGKLLNELDLMKPLHDKIAAGLPTLATCAGLILLAEHIENDGSYLGTLPVTVRRNAYGRQLGSFYTESQWQGIGKIPMTFIRAPFITAADPTIVRATIDDHIVGVTYRNQIALSFHPELNDDLRIYEQFIKMADRN
ncbi:MAG: pyridoxal 5'-phosphate synthase glutaminase subunit PdxT [Catenisphaera adipataccumulans]|jgi:5'-phosphate synthase pdxT subunit|uniref:pyridoxal 5'-phosphate synthase glutaminase subunit PdxT n=1 Tax=Catenisphaera adipataccumulans TaxID=700500 RepID=UPI003D8A50EA